MNNQNTVIKLITSIQEFMSQNNITQQNLAEICKEKSAPVSQSTISNMFKNPSSVRLSTLINVCDGLGLNLSELMAKIEFADTLPTPTINRLVYDISDPAYKGYLNTYHIYFLSTNEAQDGRLVHGILEFKENHPLSSCEALLNLDTGDKSKETNTPIIKAYTGDMVISRIGCFYCNLRSYEYGDIWTLIFNHLQLNYNSFLGSIGCGITTSSGGTRLPTIHKVFLSSKELSEENQTYILGLLRLYRNNITISSQQLNIFMNNPDLDPRFKRNIERFLDKPETFYNIPVDLLRPSVSSENFSKMLALLLQYSTMDCNNKITQNEAILASYIINSQ